MDSNSSYISAVLQCMTSATPIFCFRREGWCTTIVLFECSAVLSFIIMLYHNSDKGKTEVFTTGFITEFMVLIPMFLVRGESS